MEKIYGNPDKVRKAVANLSQFRQRKGEPFAKFLFKFKILLAEKGEIKFPAII